jgi:pyruvate formate lyase activating enzyme
VLDLIRAHKNVVDYELLPYMRFGESKYGFLGRVYEMRDFEPPAAEVMARLPAIIDGAFGRGSAP